MMITAGRLRWCDASAARTNLLSFSFFLSFCLCLSFTVLSLPSSYTDTLFLLCVPSRPTLDQTERFFILLLFFLFLLMKTTRKGRETLDMCTYIFGSNYMFMFMDVRCFTIAFCTPNLSGKNIVLSIAAAAAAAAAVAWRCLPGDCDAAAARVEMLIVATPNCLELG